jgi:hypothetical protein
VCYGAELVSWIEYVERCSLSSFVLAQGMRVCCDCCKIILCIRRLVEWDRVLMRMRLWVINGIKKVSRPVGKVCCDSLDCSESLAHGGEDGIPTFFLWRRFVLFLVASSLIPTAKNNYLSYPATEIDRPKTTDCDNFSSQALDRQ